MVTSHLHLPPSCSPATGMLHLSCGWCTAHFRGWTAGLHCSFLGKCSHITAARLGTVNIIYRYACHRLTCGDLKSGWEGEECERRGWREVGWFTVGSVRESKGGDQIDRNALTSILKTAFCSFQCLSILLPEARKGKGKKKGKRGGEKALCCLVIYLFSLRTGKLFNSSSSCEPE